MRPIAILLLKKPALNAHLRHLFTGHRLRRSKDHPFVPRIWYNLPSLLLGGRLWRLWKAIYPFDTDNT